MATKLPFDAFEYYLSLGPSRSYQAVANHHEVSKRTVTNRALKESWQKRVSQIEHEARERVNQKASETLEQMTERHLKQLRAVQGRAIEALRAMPLNTAMEAVRAIGLAQREERAIRCGPENDGDDVEAIIRREYERWMVRADDDAEEGDNHDAR